MRIRLDDGSAFRAVNLNTARGRDIVALQTETGLGLDELVAMGEDKKNQAYLTKVIEFLSERNRGKFLTFDEVLDRPLAAVIADPGDPGQREQGSAEATADPTSASTASPPVDAVEAPAPLDSTLASHSSAAPNDGSTSRSTGESSTS